MEDMFYSLVILVLFLLLLDNLFGTVTALLTLLIMFVVHCFRKIFLKKK